MIILSKDKENIKSLKSCNCSIDKNFNIRDMEIKNQSGLANSNNNKTCDCNKLNKED